MTDKDNSSSFTSTYTPIQCQLYDYVEIACMRHYNVDIELNSGETITGKAITTKVKNKQEFIVIEIDSGSDKEKKKEIRLDLVKSIQPLNENAEFGRVSIS